MERNYSMIEECCELFEVVDRDDGGIEITITAEERYKNLWIIKLNELRTNDDEIRFYEADD